MLILADAVPVLQMGLPELAGHRPGMARSVFHDEKASYDFSDAGEFR